MTEVDWVIAAAVLVSVLIGAMRGLVKELMSLVGVVVAGALALRFSPSVQGLFAAWIETPSLRAAAAFVAILFGVLIASGLLGRLLVGVIKKSGLVASDRSLGAVFGAARALILLLLVIVMAGATPVVQDRWWQQSMLISTLSPHANGLLALLPDEVASYFRRPLSVDSLTNSSNDRGVDEGTDTNPLTTIPGLTPRRETDAASE